MKNLQNLGFIPSIIDGTEFIFSAPQIPNIPNEFSYTKYMPTVLNQGKLSICVPCSISAYLNWKENLKDGSKDDNCIALMDIYRSKTTDGEGMTYKDAFSFLRKTGVTSNEGIMKIGKYCRITTINDLKCALLMNGPCLGALPVYSNEFDFWRNKPGRRLEGYHAISLVGYTSDGFIIRNSWGTEFGFAGYTKIPYDEFNELLEIWTIVG